MEETIKYGRVRGRKRRKKVIKEMQIRRRECKITKKRLEGKKG